MTRRTRWVLGGVALVAAALVAFGLHRVWQLTRIGAAYKAKTLCSAVFVSRRDPSAVLASDLAADDLAPLTWFDARVEDEAVVAGFLGLIERRAVHRKGFGCALGVDARDAPPDAGGLDRLSRAGSEAAWPLGERVAAETLAPDGAARLRQALDWAFSEPDPARLRRTRAVVVVHDGRIVAERYAPGFTENTALLGWSMTKSVVNALAGILVKEGKLSLDAPVPLAAWRWTDDGRRAVTLDHLLRMSSGLEFEEDYASPLKDVTYMLLVAPDTAGYAAGKPLAAAPGTRWQYSSGTTNILSRVIREAVGEARYHAFPRRALFDALGMTSAIIETDASGTFVGSSFMYATARDWARFGLLYLQDGVWQGGRVLPEGWVRYTRTAAPRAPRGEYGAHFWLHLPRHYHTESTQRPALPADAFHAIGHERQFVTIVPARNLVVVRLGLTRRPGAWDHALFVRRVLESLEVASDMPATADGRVGWNPDASSD